MNNKLKKSLAFIMATAMAFGGCVTALAAGGSATGTGSSTKDLYADDVIVVDMPTQDYMNTRFNFIVDPERLINSAGAVYANNGNVATTTQAAIGNDEGIYFYRNDDNDPAEVDDNYTSVSTECAMTIKNYKDVDVSITIDITTPGGFIYTDSAAHANVESDDPLLYLAFTTTNAAAEATNIISGNSVVIEDTFAGQPGNYNITAVTSGQSLYTAIESPGAVWNTYKFSMTGAVSKTQITNDFEAPEFTYTWSIDLHSDEEELDAVIVWDGNDGYIGPTSNTGYTDEQISKFKYVTVNDQRITGAEVLQSNRIKITWDQVLASGVDTSTTTKVYKVVIG